MIPGSNEDREWGGGQCFDFEQELHHFFKLINIPPL